MSQIATSKSTHECRYLLADVGESFPHIEMVMIKQRQYLIEWREYRGLTQEQAADRIEKSRNYLSELERGKRRYNEDILNALAQAYSCEPWELIGRNPLIDPEPVADLVARLAPANKEAAIKMLESLADDKKTA